MSPLGQAEMEGVPLVGILIFQEERELTDNQRQQTSSGMETVEHHFGAVAGVLAMAVEYLPLLTVPVVAELMIRRYQELRLMVGKVLQGFVLLRSTHNEYCTDHERNC
ncbi:hypothetical protein LLV50_000432 [Escherichia coli]|nr:hypothetical protein [Escherichia coli]